MQFFSICTTIAVLSLPFFLVLVQHTILRRSYFYYYTPACDYYQTFVLDFVSLVCICRWISSTTWVVICSLSAIVWTTLNISNEQTVISVRRFSFEWYLLGHEQFLWQLLGRFIRCWRTSLSALLGFTFISRFVSKNNDIFIIFILINMALIPFPVDVMFVCIVCYCVSALYRLWVPRKTAMR